MKQEEGELINRRLRARLTEREEALRFARLLAAEKDQQAQREAARASALEDELRTLTWEHAAAKDRLDRLDRSMGGRLLNAFGEIKYRYLLPLYRVLGLAPREWPADTESTPEANVESAVEALPIDQAPRSVAVAEPDEFPQPPGLYDILCFPIIDWGFRFQRPQQLMSCFADRGHRVFYVAPSFIQAGESHLVRKKRENLYEVWLRGPQRNVYRDTLDSRAAVELFESINEFRRDFALGATVSFVQLPFWAPLVLKTRDSFGWPVIYDCMDYHAGFSTNSDEMLIQENALFSKSDLVVVSSTFLELEARRHRDDVLVVRNACDYVYFSEAPPSRNERPVVGYYGAIADWFDSDLVADLAVRHPEWDFVLVGSTYKANTSRLLELDNLVLTGEKPYSEIRDWLGRFDVTILPFKRTALTEATNPVKAYEILASGRPLVSVPLPEMQALAPFVRLAATVQEFEREIDAALKENGNELRSQRKQFARENTWDNRVDVLSAEIPRLFPRAAVVIITINNLELNRQCLEALYEQTEWPNLEVIVVDNGSTDGTVDYLKQAALCHSNLVLILNSKNLGFAPAANAGLARAAGDFLVLLNNDTVITRGLISNLVRHLWSNPELGIVGPVTNEIGNEARVEAGYETLEDMPRWALDYTRQVSDPFIWPRVLAMFCVAMRKAVFQEVGPLDERFEVGMFEDDDYSRRVWMHGYGIACARDCFVHHIGRASFKLMDEAQYLEVFNKNRNAFEQKWGRWHPHSDERQRRRIPELVSRMFQIISGSGVEPNQMVVFLPSIGWRTPLFQRPHHLAEELARHGYLVFFDCSGSTIDYISDFVEVERNLWLYKGPDGVLDRLQQPIVWALPYNAYMAYRWSNRTLVYDLIDDLSVFAVNQDEIEDNHERMLRDADLILCVAQTLINNVEPRRPDAVYLPNGVEYSLFASADRSSQIEGSLADFLNGDRPVAGYYGAIAGWLDVELLREVGAQRPDWNFIIIGHALAGSPSLEPLEELPNFRIVSAQPYRRLPGYLARFTVAMIPFKLNRITESTSPIKLYEYFAGGKPVVSTPLPECRAFPEVLIAGDAPEFSKALDTAKQLGASREFTDRLRELGGLNSWTSRIELVIEKIRAIEARPDETPFATEPTETTAIPAGREDLRYAGRFPGMFSIGGRCNVCGADTLFFYEDENLYRESLTCAGCLTTSRYRSIARGILRAFKDLAGVDGASLSELSRESGPPCISVYDTQTPLYFQRNAYPIPDVLAVYPWIDLHLSTYKQGMPTGIKLGARTWNQSLESLTFQDAAFDLVITSDVMEHVRLDDRAHAEIRRVLRPGGIYLFTVPHTRSSFETFDRVAVTDPSCPSRDIFLVEKEYHGDANSVDGMALSYRTYGCELDRTLERLGFDVEYTNQDFSEMGIINTELFFCKLAK